MHISTSENTNISSVDAPEDDQSGAATSKGILLRPGNAREKGVCGFRRLQIALVECAGVIHADEKNSASYENI